MRIRPHRSEAHIQLGLRPASTPAQHFTHGPQHPSQERPLGPKWASGRQKHPTKTLESPCRESARHRLNRSLARKLKPSHAIQVPLNECRAITEALKVDPKSVTSLERPLHFTLTATLGHHRGKAQKHGDEGVHLGQPHSLGRSLLHLLTTLGTGMCT